MSKFSLFFSLIFLIFAACKNDTPTEKPADGSETTSASNGSAPAGGTISGTDGNSGAAGQGNFTPSGTAATSDPGAPSIATGSETPSAPSAAKSAPATSSSSYSDKPVYGKERKSETYTTIIPDDTKTGKGPGLLPIPDPCTLLSEAYLKSTFGLKNDPDIKNGSKKTQSAEKSCFFKFEDPKKPNGGIMMQIMTNPYPEEIPDYPELVIKGKINDGEQVPYDNKVIKFKAFNDLGDGGCYSYEAGKYHWKIKDQYVFMLAFNTSHDEATQKQLAIKIGREFMKNFLGKVTIK